MTDGTGAGMKKFRVCPALLRNRRFDVDLKNQRPPLLGASEWRLRAPAGRPDKGVSENNYTGPEPGGEGRARTARCSCHEFQRLWQMM